MTEHPIPYVRRHLASHAAVGGVLEDLLNAERLPYLDAVRLSELLRVTQAQPDSPLWVLLGAWRSIRHRWSWEDPGANAAALDVALLASGVPPPERRNPWPTWRPRWAHWMTGGTVVGSAEGRKPASAFGAVAGRPVLAASRSNEVWVWEAATGQLVGEPFLAPDLLEGVAMGGDGGSSLVAIERSGRVSVWDATTRVLTQQFTLPDAGFRGVTTGRLAGRWLVAAAGATGQVHTRWLDSGEPAMEPFRTWWGGDGAVRALSLAETPDGTLAAVGHADGTVALWKLDTGELLSLFDVGSEVNAVAVRYFADDDTMVAVGTSSGHANVWGLRYRMMLGPRWVHTSEVRAVALAKAGITAPMLAAGCLDGSVLVGPVDMIEYGGILLPHPAEVTTVEFGDVDGRTMLATTCVDGNTRLWYPRRSPVPRAQVDGRIGDIAIVERSDGGIDVLTGDDRPTLQRWFGENGFVSLEVDVAGSGPVRKMKWAREPTAAVAAGYLDGRLTALTSYLGNVALWGLGESSESAELLQEHALDDGVGTAALFVGQGRALFARSGWSQPASVVDAATGKAQRLKSRRREQDRVLGFHAGTEHIWLATANDETVTLHDVTGAGPVGPPLPTFGRASAVALGSFDGSEALAVLSQGALRLWDPRSRTQLVRPFETSESARQVAWAHLADRDVLLTRHFATLRVWNPHTGRKLAELPLGTSIDAMAVHSSPYGRVHVAIGGPGLVFTELHDATVDR